MKQGEVEYAVRKAYEEFDKWNNVAGQLTPNTGYYYEALACIETAVHIGIQMALEGKINYDEDRVVIIPKKIG